jgi:hypothetical protein
MSTSPFHTQLLTIQYREELLRVVIHQEIRFVTEDICRIAKVPAGAVDQRGRAEVSCHTGVSEPATMPTLGWSQALNLIDMGDLACEAVQHFGTWFLHDVIAHLCQETALTGTEIIDTSAVQYSSLFRHAMTAAMVNTTNGVPVLFH